MSLEDWKVVKLESIKSSKKYSLVGGPFGSNLVKHDYVNKGVPVIRGTNISGDARFSLDDLVYVSEEKADDLLPNNANAGDVVFTQRGTLGQIGIIPHNSGFERFVISQSQMKLTVDENKAISMYVYYYFKSEHIVQTIHNLAISSGVPHINLQILREFEISLPPLDTQHKIAAILSAYDDLIENNTRRIHILEEMAQTLYRHWFVDFKFPGHEEVRLVDSGTEFGLVPEGWDVVAFSSLFDIKYGKTLPKTEMKDGGIYPVYGAGGIIGYYDKVICIEKVTLVTCRGNGSGTVWRTKESAYITNNSLFLLPNLDSTRKCNRLIKEYLKR